MNTRKPVSGKARKPSPAAPKKGAPAASAKGKSAASAKNAKPTRPEKDAPAKKSSTQPAEKEVSARDKRKYIDFKEKVKKGDPLPPFDMHCPMMSLPLAFKTTLDTVPACPHFVISEAKTQFWANKLGLKTKPRVGLV